MLSWVMHFSHICSKINAINSLLSIFSLILNFSLDEIQVDPITFISKVRDPHMFYLIKEGLLKKVLKKYCSQHFFLVLMHLGEK